jgi:hypothetical protein
MLLLNKLPEYDLRRQVFGVFTHFDEFVSADKFTTTTENSGAVSNVDAIGGQVTIVTGATDNNETYLASTKELFLITNGKPIHAAARLKYSEASGTAANVAFGLMNAVGADAIVDNGAGLKSSYSGAAFYKVDGGTLWNAEASIGTTRYGNALLNANNSLDKIAKAAAGTVFQWLEISITPHSATLARVDFFIDGIHVWTTEMTYTNATEMQVFIGAKTGSANALTVTADFLGAIQKL